MGIFERYLSIWVALSMFAGVLLGFIFPNIFQLISHFEYASINFVIAIFIWIMIFPMMVNVDFSSLKSSIKQPKGLFITLVVNWLVKPFTMAGLGILFFKYIFASLVNPTTANEYIAGMILLGVAPCTAMVFVWSNLVKGDSNYCLVQVSINDIIMVFAFAPIAGLLLGISHITVPWSTLLLSILLYVIVPLVAGYITRVSLKNDSTIQHFTHLLKPYSILGLLLTVVVLFGLQAKTIIHAPFVIALIAVPLLIQNYAMFFIAYIWAYIWKVPFNIAAPAALISTSNFFELAVAVAISLFGLNSGASLATVVGVLVEVPVMLSLVYYANKTKGMFN